MPPLRSDEFSNPLAELDPAVLKLAAVRLQVHLAKFGGSFASIDDGTATEIAAVIASLLGSNEGKLE